MPSKRSVLKKIRAGLIKVPEGWEELVDTIQPTTVETTSTVEATVETPESHPEEDFRNRFPPTTKTETATTASKKTTRKPPGPRKTTKPKKSS